MVMELTTAAYETGEKTAGGELWQTLSIPDYIHGYTEQAGSPRIPAKAVLIGVPQDATVSLRILESESTVLEGYYDNIIPVPTAVEYDEGVLTDEYIRDADVYGLDSLSPGLLAEVSAPEELRNRMVSRVVFYPLQYNPRQRFSSGIMCRPVGGTKAGHHCRIRGTPM
jgi:hypothetical protein